MQVARLLLLVASCCWEGWRGKLVSGGALSLHHQVFSDHFKNVDSNWSYACAPDIVNVFEGGLMLPGCLEYEPRSNRVVPAAAMSTVTEFT